MNKELEKLIGSSLKRVLYWRWNGSWKWEEGVWQFELNLERS